MKSGCDNRPTTPLPIFFVSLLPAAMAYGFALHTTSTWLGLALIDCAEGVTDTPDTPDTPQTDTPHTRSYDLGRDMITHLHLHTQEFLAPHTWADLSFIAVAKGPGSFTSTRIGVVMARTLGQQLDLPVFGISTLAAAAYADVLWHRDDRNCDYDSPSGDRAVELDAARGQVFTGIYRNDRDRDDLVCLQADSAMSPTMWREQIANRQPSPISLSVKPDRITEDTAAIAILARNRWLGGDRPAWFELTPFYGQHPVT